MKVQEGNLLGSGKSLLLSVLVLMSSLRPN